MRELAEAYQELGRDQQAAALETDVDSIRRQAEDQKAGKANEDVVAQHEILTENREDSEDDESVGRGRMEGSETGRHGRNVDDERRRWQEDQRIQSLTKIESLFNRITLEESVQPLGSGSVT